MPLSISFRNIQIYALLWKGGLFIFLNDTKATTWHVLNLLMCPFRYFTLLKPLPLPGHCKHEKSDKFILHIFVQKMNTHWESYLKGWDGGFWLKYQFRFVTIVLRIEMFIWLMKLHDTPEVDLYLGKGQTLVQSLKRHSPTPPPPPPHSPPAGSWPAS